MQVWYEIGGTARDKGDINIMNVDGDIVDSGYNGELGGEADESDRVMNEGNKSFTTRVTRNLLSAYPRP